MISFKQYLSEKAMNSAEFKKVQARQGATSKVGFEFEFFVPEHSSLLGKSTKDPHSIPLSAIDNVDEIQEYFDASNKDIFRIEREFEGWREDKKSEWIKDNTDIDDSEVEEHGKSAAEGMAHDRAVEEFERREDEANYNFKSFVSDEYGTLYNLLDKFSIDPKYGWYSNSHNDRSWVFTEEADNDETEHLTFKNVADELSNYLDTKVVNGYGNFDKGEWSVTSDGSITGDDIGHGAEVISPPEPLNDALRSLKGMFRFMEDYDVITNNSTGLHINISMPGIENVDLVKLVLFMGDTYALEQFDRLQNTYTSSQLENIISTLKDLGKLPKDASTLKAAARSALSSAKYSSVNISKLSQGYLEFRIAGNFNYHKKFDLVKSTVMRFVSALEVAVDPLAEKNEYLKKLIKILDVAEANDDESKKFSTKSIIDILNDDGKENIVKALNTALDKSNEVKQENIESWFVNDFLKAVFRAFLGLKIKSINFKQKVEMRNIIKKLNIDIKKFQTMKADPWLDHILKILELRK